MNTVNIIFVCFIILVAVGVYLIMKPISKIRNSKKSSAQATFKKDNFFPNLSLMILVSSGCKIK